MLVWSIENCSSKRKAVTHIKVFHVYFITLKKITEAPSILILNLMTMHKNNFLFKNTNFNGPNQHALIYFPSYLKNFGGL